MGMAIDGEGRAATTASGAVLASSATAPSTAVEAAVASSSLTEPSSSSSSQTPSAVGDVAGTHGGECETSEQKARRLRSNSEETALILTSMMSMSKPATTTTRSTYHDSDDDDDGGDGSRHSDMGEDISGDEDMDEEYKGHGKGKGRVPTHVQLGGGSSGSKLDFLDDAGFSHRFRNESNRVKSLVTKHISIDELRDHFDRPIIDVAKDFGICITLMKKICRRNGIKRWPHRQIRSLSKSIASMEAAMLSSQGPERDKYRDQILSLKLKRDSVIADPNKENAMAARPKTPTTKDLGTSRPHTHIHAAAPKLSPRAGSLQASATPAGTVKDGQASHSKGGRWTSEEHAAFLQGIRLFGKDWRRVAQVVRTRSAVQTRTHAQKYLLKFAGRFPFDADGLGELKAEPTNAAASADGNDGTGVMAPTTLVSAVNEKETDGGDTASMSSSSHDDDSASVSVSHGVTSIPPSVELSPSSPSSSSPSVLRAPSAAPVALTVDTSSALETMAMILNSPQFGSPQFRGSFRQLAPPQIQTHSLSLADDMDVVMESPRGSASGNAGGVPATLPLLPSFVIKPGTWPAQPPAKSESPVSSPAP